VGADIGLHVGKNFMNEWPERNYKAFIFPLLNEAGMLGEKTGKGFYAFDKKCADLLCLWSVTQLRRFACPISCAPHARTRRALCLATALLV